jgi:cation transport ATPase
MSDGKGTAVVNAELMESEASPQPAPPYQVANIQTNNTLNLSSSAEAALVQRLTPENITAALQAGTELQRLQFQLAEKELDLEQAKAARAHEAEQANSVREHEREMKRLEHRGHNEQSQRWIGFVILVLIALFVAACVYRGETGFAAGIVASLASATAGFAGGRSFEKLKERRPRLGSPPSSSPALRRRA